MGCRETDGAERSPQGAGVEGRRLHQPKDEVGRAGGVLVGDPKRIALVAADLVAHFEKRVEARLDWR